ncbi:hypothetical protein [Novosphingobium sp. KN65.2]|uniref:hypothetical protein n=1 Tax=Novosphingobium sp. KN65.2 TaxID=1478134 RepID=UPI0005DFB8B5|nr:hypothetical protein [Novosphingobium sp. KN65.2]CDO34317.1 conserved hypothetical protein [Novosphingobium sp. KN65.2]
MSGQDTTAKTSGRPTAYREEFAVQAEKLCALGATDLELADFFQVDVRTIYRWKHTHDEFCQALKVGKDVLDDRVERSLYQRAVGYSFNSEKVFHFQGHITRAETIEHVPPDPGAALSWLKNRRGDKWRDKIEHEHGVTEDVAAILAERRAKVAKLNGE